MEPVIFQAHMLYYQVPTIFQCALILLRTGQMQFRILYASTYKLCTLQLYACAFKERSHTHMKRHNPPVVRHVTHQIGTTRVSNFAEALVVQVPRVCRCPTDDETRLVHCCQVSKILIVDKSGVRMHAVGQRLKELGCRRNVLHRAVLHGRVIPTHRVSPGHRTYCHDLFADAAAVYTPPAHRKLSAQSARHVAEHSLPLFSSV